MSTKIIPIIEISPREATGHTIHKGYYLKLLFIIGNIIRTKMLIDRIPS
jgi:hypothetical protein